MNKTLFIGTACLAAFFAHGAPYLPEELQLRVTINLGADLGVPNSTFNPRIFDGDNYANQINSPVGFGRYPSGSGTAEMVVNNSDIPLEHRMVAPFRGANSTTYLLGSGGAVANTFSRYDFDGSNRVDVVAPSGETGEGYDWVDNDTIIYTSYNPSGSRRRLYLADVTAEPFAVTANTTWNANGFVTSSVATRLRNVRVGDVYSGYAYYGNAGLNDNPNFYALNLATGVETLLGNAGQLTGSGSFGIWTVLERGGYLYVQTTDNGIQVYNMNSATSLGDLYTTYSKEILDAITGLASHYQYFGLDVTPDGSKLLLSALEGKVFELGQPNLTVSTAGTDVVLAWPGSVTAVVVQSSSNLSSGFTDLDPQPFVNFDGIQNTVTLPIGTDAEFFRLRKAP